MKNAVGKYRVARELFENANRLQKSRENGVSSLSAAGIHIDEKQVVDDFKQYEKDCEFCLKELYAYLQEVMK